MATNWSEREKPTSNWMQREAIETDWGSRIRPITYMTPLQDAYRIVRDEDNEVIYIISNEGQPIAITEWEERKSI